MKLCYKCGQAKPEEMFNRNKARADGLNSACRECHNAHSRAYYQVNGERQRRQISASRKRVKENRYDKLWTLLRESSCVDCETTDPRVLEFDHLPEFGKAKGIAEMIRDGDAWEAILEEMKKCEIVCANCHRIRTYSRANSHRHKKWVVGINGCPQD